MKKLLNKVRCMNNTQLAVFEVCLVVASFAAGGLVVAKYLEGGCIYE